MIYYLNLSHEIEEHRETREMFHTLLGLKNKTEVGEQKEFKPFQKAETLSQKARRLSKESYAKSKSDG